MIIDESFYAELGGLAHDLSGMAIRLRHARHGATPPTAAWVALEATKLRRYARQLDALITPPADGNGEPPPGPTGPDDAEANAC